MRPETVLLIRRLAREATIFALLSMVLAGIGVFVVMDNEDRTSAKRQAETAVHAGIDLSAGLEPPVKPAPTVQVPLTNGIVLQVRRCETEGLWTKYQPKPKDEFEQYRVKPKFDPNAPVDPSPDCRKFASDPIAILDSVPLGNADQVAIEKDYWTTYKEARHHDLGVPLFGTLLVSSLGFAAGLVLWIFYRLVRFAVKG